ncbi:flagellar motor stator protein MotA [Pandoraea pulmonicola]|uniref:Chemotaxis protein MotA n=1 Tax=Pandoraea pulmonicola TaxID=93221 RepID=A0AAJ4ZB76_PANPU|nr:flagellar motor stator protein MotA [Pandoraea pulmonicola]AJC21205.1 flagellar motor stator protein MotA [Pandoraea pulmonicola]SUA90116.1 Chemotaxis protein MotA [Pandoraea pulmonicola]
MQLTLGVLLVIGGVFGGFVLHGGSLRLIWQPTEIMIIGSAAVGALVIGNSRSVLTEIWRQLKQVVRHKNLGVEFQRQLLLLLYELLEMVRDGGLKALDQHVEDPHDSDLFQRYPAILDQPRLVSFIVDNFRLMAMGRITAHELEGMLDQELEAIEEELMQPSRSLGKLAEAMPGFGILAAVLGIVTTMANIDGEVAEIGMQVAAAMVGTFIGILLCYGALDPLAGAMAHRVKSELSSLECVKVVLCAQVAGKPTLLAVDAGRKLIQLEVKPSFARLESWIMDI